MKNWEINSVSTATTMILCKIILAAVLFCTVAIIILTTSFRKTVVVARANSRNANVARPLCVAYPLTRLSFCDVFVFSHSPSSLLLAKRAILLATQVRSRARAHFSTEFYQSKPSIA